MTNQDPLRIIAHRWTLIAGGGWRLAIQGSDHTTGTLTITIGCNEMRTINTDAGARQLMHLIPANEIQKRLR